MNTSDDSESEEWPICEVEDCGEEVDPRRVAIIGVPRCLRHGASRKSYTVAPAYNKGGYQLITRENIQDIGKAK